MNVYTCAHMKMFAGCSLVCEFYFLRSMCMRLAEFELPTFCLTYIFYRVLVNSLE